jgi:hypothetical protein
MTGFSVLLFTLAWRFNRLTRALDDNLQVAGQTYLGGTSTCRIAPLNRFPATCYASHYLPSPLVISPDSTEYFETMSMPSIKFSPTTGVGHTPLPSVIQYTLYGFLDRRFGFILRRLPSLSSGFFHVVLELLPMVDSWQHIMLLRLASSPLCLLVWIGVFREDFCSSNSSTDLDLFLSTDSLVALNKCYK